MPSQPRVIALIEDNPAESIDFLCRNAGENRLPDCDLIVMDLNLPFVTKFEVLAKIKNDTTLRKIPVIILSSSSNPKDIERCYHEGANSYLCKPIDLKDILAMASHLVGFWLNCAKLPTEQRTMQPHHFSI